MSDENTSGKTFSEDTVAVLLMATGCVSIATTQYAMMSALDGTKTASSFQHQFRSVLKKAKELKTRAESGETFEAVAPSKKRAGAAEGATPPTTPKKPKATPKSTPKATPNGRGKKKTVESTRTNRIEDSILFDTDMSAFKKEELDDDFA